MQRSLDMLANESDLTGFLGRVLGEIGARLGARYLLIWLMDGDAGTAAPRLAWTETHGAGSAEDLLPSEVTMAILKQGANPRGTFGTTALLNLPLLAGEVRLGAITALLTQAAQLPVAEIEWVEALAHHATLALRFDTLSAEREAMAVSKERARMAREIHDGIAQTFIGIHRHLRNALATPDAQTVASAIELAKDGLAEARRAVKALRPAQLSDMSFPDAVQEAARKVIPQQIQVRLSTTGKWPKLPPDRETHLFRAIQEAFNNVARHSFATQLNVALSSTPGGLRVHIQDNGRGFDVLRNEAGFGLRSMRERMDGVDGFFEMASVPGSGTTVVMGLRAADIPKSPRA
jgi:signal transduction histidine kinase